MTSGRGAPTSGQKEGARRRALTVPACDGREPRRRVAACASEAYGRCCSGSNGRSLRTFGSSSRRSWSRSARRRGRSTAAVCARDAARARIAGSAPGLGSRSARATSRRRPRRQSRASRSAGSRRSTSSRLSCGAARAFPTVRGPRQPHCVARRASASARPYQTSAWDELLQLVAVADSLLHSADEAEQLPTAAGWGPATARTRPSLSAAPRSKAVTISPSA
jgi:hypothetical protein